jgi:hypothetical protein
MGGGGGGEVYSLKGGAGSVMPLEGDGTTKSGRGGREVICVFLTPSSQGDYRTARSLADMGRSVVIVNGSFKVRSCGSELIGFRLFIMVCIMHRNTDVWF